MKPHKWEQWVESESIRALLWAAKESLRMAWSYDQKHPKTFPMNTAYKLSEILADLSEDSLKKKLTVGIAAPKVPKKLADLVPEGLVAEIWEMNHICTYRSAIAKAGGFGRWRGEDSSKIFAQILKTIELAYIACRFGDDVLPKPKVNILHQGLKRIAEAAGLYGQTVEGFSEFLDDLCPCGLKRHNEAVRKLYSRSRKAAP